MKCSSTILNLEIWVHNGPMDLFLRAVYNRLHSFMALKICPWMFMGSKEILNRPYEPIRNSISLWYFNVDLSKHILFYSDVLSIMDSNNVSIAIQIGFERYWLKSLSNSF